MRKNDSEKMLRVPQKLNVQGGYVLLNEEGFWWEAGNNITWSKAGYSFFESKLKVEI